ncbi:PAS domain-containing sensor histidine kinase [uncultured Draconibacterium sp.]|uniref:sensor histidine kinase n=1 Tax=uncultured Draconibacterium sp. TaxID=1573823 RepID=UPI0025E5D5F9|nr:PAS domain-containing sensor histidine kinase [uncultured Draconibacterium sp.]
MDSIILNKTKFAPAERSTEMQLKSQKQTIMANEMVIQFCDAISQMLVVLNKNRQIIYANKHFMNNLGLLTPDSYIGKRPGEAVKCAHAIESTGGCGTSEFCRTCGAVNAILEAQQGKQAVKECRIITESRDALDLKVTATPLTIKKEEYSIFEINDISHEKRRKSLERVFFHDVLNSAGGIAGLSDIIGTVVDQKEIDEIAGMIHTSAHNLIGDIQSQRQLSAAERGDLKLNLSDYSAFQLIKEIAQLYANHEVAYGKTIGIDNVSEDFIIETDVSLLRRIIGNMTKNALEASLPGSKVVLKALLQGEKKLFSVHNAGFIARDAQLQLFKRSYTTKGAGRGLGTYSMKLFGEKYLGGKVWFESTKDAGTTFFIQLK